MREPYRPHRRHHPPHRHHGSGSLAAVDLGRAWAGTKSRPGDGITDWQPNSYASHYVTVDGVRFRVQILWGAAIDHGDHVHVGIRRM